MPHFQLEMFSTVSVERPLLSLGANKCLCVCNLSNEFGLDVRDPVQQNFSEILKDITMFYTKKLDMLNIKLEHHQRTKMDPEHHELVHVGVVCLQLSLCLWSRKLLVIVFYEGLYVIMSSQYHKATST